jgi:hypothetical protein
MAERRRPNQRRHAVAFFFLGNKARSAYLSTYMIDKRLTLCVVGILLATMLVAQNALFDVGIKVGQKIPSFRLIDHNGVARDFASLKGPNGVVLLFFRSADW